MSSQTKTHVTPEEYLALERAAEYKNEYLDGEIVAMTGASREHNLIQVNIVAELRNQLKGHPCEVYPSEMRVRIPSTNSYTYPDAAVVCGEPQFEDESVDTLLNPTLIVEVLSKSTASYDRTEKFGHYRTIDALREYLLVSQDKCKVEQYVRQADGRWLLSDVISRESSVELASVPCVLKLAEVYHKVSFE